MNGRELDKVIKTLFQTPRIDNMRGPLDFSSSYSNEKNLLENTRRILLVSPEPFFEERGTPIAVRHVIKALTEHGRAVDILTYPVGDAVDIPGLRVYRFGKKFGFRHIPIGLSAKKLILDAALYSQITKRLLTENYSHIHALEEAIFPAILAGKRFNIPVIYDMQSSMPEQLTKFMVLRHPLVQKGLNLCERWAIRNADHVICSAGMKSHVRSQDPFSRAEEWLFPVEKHEVSKGQVKNLRKQVGIDKSKKIVLYTGNFESYQGVQMLLDAVPAIVNTLPHVVILLVGKHGHSDVVISREVNALIEKGIVKILPRQKKEEIPIFLELADVIVSPRSFGSNIGIKVFEYMAAGKPIVASDIPTHRSILDKTTARLVKPTPRDFAEGVLSLLHNSYEAVGLATAAKIEAEKKYGWTGFVSRLSLLYARSQNKRSGRGNRGGTSSNQSTVKGV